MKYWLSSVLVIIAASFLTSCNPGSDESETERKPLSGIWDMTTPYGTITTPITSDGRFASWANIDGTAQVLYGSNPHSIAHGTEEDSINGSGYICYLGSSCYSLGLEGSFESDTKFVGTFSQGSESPSSFVANRNGLSDSNVSIDYLVGSWSLYGDSNYSLTISKSDQSNAVAAGFDSNSDSVSAEFTKIDKNIFEFNLTRKYGTGTETLSGLAFVFTISGFKYIDMAAIRIDSNTNTYTHFVANFYTAE